MQNAQPILIAIRNSQTHTHTHIPIKYSTNAPKWKCNVLECLRYLHSFERIDYFIRLTIDGYTEMALFSDFFAVFVQFYCVR